MKQLVIGLGEIGKPLFDLLRLGYEDVHGRDQQLGDEPVIVDVLHVCFPYGDEFIQSVGVYARFYGARAVVIHSTVPVGTTRAIAERIGPIEVSYSPVRGRHRHMHRDLLVYPKWIASPQGCDLAITAMEKVFTVQFTTPTENLELAKLLETSYSALLIAWSQEMARYCDEVEGDYLEVCRFFTNVPHLPQVAYLPGVIGGHCLMPNLDLLEGVMPSNFIESIRVSNRAREQDGDLDPDERLRPVPLEALGL